MSCALCSYLFRQVNMFKLSWLRKPNKSCMTLLIVSIVSSAPAARIDAYETLPAITVDGYVYASACVQSKDDVHQYMNVFSRALRDHDPANAEQNITLAREILTGQTGSLKEALNRGVDPGTVFRVGGAKTMSLLALSALGCQDDVAQLLVQAGADPNDSGSYYPLHIAAANGNVSLAEFLLDQGAKVDSVNPNGRTPLEVAVRARQLSTVRLLLKRDPDPRRTISKADASVRVLMADAKSPNDMAIAKLLKPYRVQQEAKKH